jgi:uncharacterized protein (TIGR02246 family)
MEPESTQTLFEEYINAADLESALSLYDSEAVVIQQDGSIKRGTNEIRQHLEGLLSLKPRISTIVLNTVRVGNVAMIFSKWRILGESNNREAVDVTGKSYDIVTLKSDGTWRIAIDNPFSKSMKHENA